MEKGERVAVIAVGVNLLLFIIKYVFALLSGSIALKAESYDSLMDIIASSTVLVGLIISKRKTRRFPYGLYKVENLISVFLAFAIFYAGYQVAMEALSSDVSEIRLLWPTVGSVITAIVINYLFSRYELKIGKEIDSPSLIADAKHVRVDMLAHSIVLAGLLSSVIGLNLDRIAALLIIVFILYAGGSILLNGIRVLLDASLDYETLRTAEEIISNEPQVRRIRDLKGRNSGRYKFIEADIVVKTHDLDKAYYVANHIERELKKEIMNVDRVLIHYEPAMKEELIYAMPLEDAGDERLSEHFGEAPYFALVKVRVKDDRALGKEIIRNPYMEVEKGKGILVAELLVKRNVDVVLTKESFEHKGPSYVFSDAAVDLEVMGEGIEDMTGALKDVGVRVKGKITQSPGEEGEEGDGGGN